ncbi:hypothetical protein [Burkholderia stagnalis]
MSVNSIRASEVDGGGRYQKTKETGMNRKVIADDVIRIYCFNPGIVDRRFAIVDRM